MRTRAASVVLLPLLTGCGPDSWYRAERVADYEGHLIYRAGLDDDSCLVLYVDRGGGHPLDAGEHASLADVHVELPGIEDARVWAGTLDVGADLCGARTIYWFDFFDELTPITTGAGNLRFIEHTDEDGQVELCEVEIQASLEGWSIDERLPIGGRWLDCAESEGKPFEVDELGASSPHSREDFLALRSWDVEREICYGLDFTLYGVDAPEREGQDLPAGWTLTDVHMILLGSESGCRSGDWWSDDPDSELDPVWLWTDPRDARGELRFEASQPWINPFDDTPTPCRVSVDIEAEFNPLVHWSPTKLRFVAEGIEVAQACDD